MGGPLFSSELAEGYIIATSIIAIIFGIINTIHVNISLFSSLSTLALPYPLDDI